MFKQIKKLLNKEPAPAYPAKHFSSDDYFLKPSFWDGSKIDTGNFLEAEVYELLQKHINQKYMILPHVSLREIFWVSKAVKRYPYRAFLAVHHVDFLIIDKVISKPILGIELDGSSHVNNTTQIKSDQFKDSLFQKVGLPLVRIPLSENLLDINYYIQKFNRNTLDIPVYHYPCNHRMNRRQGIHGIFYSCPVCRQESGNSQTLSLSYIPDIFS